MIWSRDRRKETPSGHETCTNRKHAQEGLFTSQWRGGWGIDIHKALGASQVGRLTVGLGIICIVPAESCPLGFVLK